MTIEDVDSLTFEVEWHRERYESMLKDKQPAWVLEDEKGPLCAYGVVLLWPGVGEGWISLIAVRNLKMMLLVLRAHIKQDIQRLPLKRLHAVIKRNFCKGKKFAEFLGFEYEASLDKYYFDGSDVDMYVRFS